MHCVLNGSRMDRQVEGSDAEYIRYAWSIGSRQYRAHSRKYLKSFALRPSCETTSPIEAVSWQLEPRPSAIHDLGGPQSRWELGRTGSSVGPEAGKGEARG